MDQSILQEKVSHVTRNRPFSIHHTVIPENSESALYPHWHSEMEWFYLERGSLDFILNGHRFRMEAGDLLLIPQFAVHSAISVEKRECSFFAFVVSMTYMIQSVPDSGYMKYLSCLHGNEGCLLLNEDKPWQQQMKKYFLEICDCFGKPVEINELKIQGNYLLLWYELVENTERFQEKDGEMQRRLKQSARLQSLFEYINEAYGEDITLEQMAELVCMGREQLCRIFKKVTGQSPFTYLNRFRIQKSCEYLRETDKKVSEIAVLCGYNNISYFNREFKKYTGRTPAEFRK